MTTKFLGLQDWEETLDLCCGQGRHTLELARRGFTKVHGLDRSRYLIRRARAGAAAEQLKIDFKEGDARKLPYQSDRFDTVLILGNSFGYFDSKQDDALVLNDVRRVLKPGGRFLMDIADGDHLARHYEARSWEWIDENMFVCRERSLDQETSRLICREVITSVQGGVIADQIYAVRLYNRDTISDLLRKAGFENIAFHQDYTPDSARGQDLGMMEQRILLTGEIKKEWSARKRGATQKQIRVAVVMGDHRQPDPIKPGQVFDADDFDTIAKLKAALTSIPGHSFSFLDEHKTLIPSLTKLAPNIDYVFNLCDEGYGNDPRKELHIPALLDALKLPYTGSGPQCLAACYDKSLVRGVAREIGIPIPRGFLLQDNMPAVDMPISFPLIVKPNFGDSSFGILPSNVVYGDEELLDIVGNLKTQFGYDKPVLVEEFLTGSEITIGILGQPEGEHLLLPILEEDYSMLPPELPRICGYDAKWDPESPYWKIRSVRANLSPQAEEMIQEWSLRLAKRLDCRDYMRLDWRLDSEGTPRLLEVNPNPGWCWDGHLAKAAALSSVDYPKLIQLILSYAEQRIGIDSASAFSALSNTADVKVA